MVPVAMPCEHGLRGTGVCAPRFIPATGDSFLMKNRVGPDLPNLFGILPGKFRELRTFCCGAMLQCQAIRTDTRGIEHQSQVFIHSRCKIIAGLVIAFARISSNDRNGIGALSDCSDDEIGGNASRAWHQNRAH